MRSASLKLAAVIVTFNRFEKLKETVCRTLREPFSFIVIVDNASTDETKTWLENLDDDRLIVKHLKKNTGGAGGFHHGFKTVAEETDADWLVCFDDDAYPEKGTVERFCRLALPETVASVAAAVYLPGGDISEMNRPRQNPFWHLHYFIRTALKGKRGFYVSDDAYQTEMPSEIDASSFVGYFVRCDLVKTVFGLPRTELFIYADDLIYSMQAHRHGYLHLFYPQLHFMHDCATLVNQEAVYRPIWKVYYTYRNRIEMYRIGFGIFFYPLLWLETPVWRRHAGRYDNPALFSALFEMALADAKKRDFSRTHEALLAFIREFEYAQ